MLFNSHIFIFIFLPIVLIGFYLIGSRAHHRVATAWLVLASLIFYGYWRVEYLWLILFSMFFNYGLGIYIAGEKETHKKKIYLSIGVVVNLSFLGFFKYANFFVDTVNYLGDSNYHLEKIILPIAISFFTFQQIAYLFDAHRGETREYNFMHYALFVTFFPQLIAGPIVHHKEMLPQFAKEKIYKFSSHNLSIGITIFFIGLFKKVVIADSIAPFSTSIFNASQSGVEISFFYGWVGALSYTFQLYFDFSGYSDMAIGIGRMFGIILPLNFHSPYKAVNIIDFWRRWHITLSRFLRDYLYFPLGGNRKGKTRRYVNLMITMVLGGLWHGAGWTFVFWGFLHGAYLCINNLFRKFREKVLGHDLKETTKAGMWLSRIVTFLSVVVAWVFFRAESFDSAVNIVKGMFGANGYAMPEKFIRGFGILADYLTTIGVDFEVTKIISSKGIFPALLFLTLLVWLAPNTQQIMNRENPGLDTYDNMRTDYNGVFLFIANKSWAIIIAIIASVSVLYLTRLSEFLYFQF